MTTTQPRQAAERNEMDRKGVAYPSVEAKRADVEQRRLAHEKATEAVDAAKRKYNKAQEALMASRDEERAAWRAYWQAMEGDVPP